MPPPEPPFTDRAPPPRDPLVRYCLLIIAIVAALFALEEAQTFAAPTMIAGLVALALAPLVDRLERLRLPAALAAAAVVLGSTAALLAGLYMLLPDVEALEDGLPEILREVESRIREVAEDVQEEVAPPASDPAATPPPAPPAPVSAAPVAPEGEAAPQAEPEAEAAPGDSVIASGQQFLTDVALSAPGLAATIVYGGFLALFLLIQRRSLARGVLAAAPAGPARYRIARAMGDVRRDVSSYLLAISAINAALGVATGLAFWALDMPSPALWGLGMALLNFAPYIGPVVMNAVAFLAAVFWYDDIVLALYPVLALIALNTLEGWIITPLLVGRQVHVNVLAVFLAVSFGAWIWGAAGALIGTPALIVVRAFIVRLRTPRRRPLSGAARRAAFRWPRPRAARSAPPPRW